MPERLLIQSIESEKGEWDLSFLQPVNGKAVVFRLQMKVNICDQREQTILIILEITVSCLYEVQNAH